VEKWQLTWQEDKKGYILLRIDKSRDEPIRVRKHYWLAAQRDIDLTVGALQAIILAVGDEFDLELPYLQKLLRDKKRQRAMRVKQKDPLAALLV